MSKKKSDQFQTGMKVGKWLHDVGLFENPAVKTRFVHGLRTGDFSSLKSYLQKHPGLLQKGKTIYQANKMMQEHCPFDPFPRDGDFSGNISLGNVYPTYADFRISAGDLPRHLLVVGQSGAGKSNFAKVFIRETADKVNARFWIFDQNKEYRDLKTHLDFLVLRVKDFWDNPFEKPTDALRDKDWLEIICQVFERELNFKTASKNILFDVLDWLFQQRNIYAGKRGYPTCRDVLNVLNKKQNNSKATFQVRDSYNALINRFKTLCNAGRFYTTARSIPIQELLSKNIIFEVEGSMSELYSLFLCVMLSKAFYYRMAEKPDLPMHVNIVEEARTAFDSRRAQNIELGEPTLNQIMSQYRKFNGSFMVITQEPSSISDTPKANVYTTVALPMTYGKEVQSVQQSMLLSPKQLKFYQGLSIGQALVKYGGMNPFVLQVPQFSDSVETPSDETIKQASEAFLEGFCKPAAKQEQEEPEIQEDPAETNQEPAQVSAEALKVIYTLVENPFLKFTELVEKTGFGVARLNKVCALLEEQGYAYFQKIKASRGKPSKFVVLTESAYEVVKAKKPRGKGSFESKLYAHIVSSYLLKAGHKAKIEGKTPHSGKLIDVLAEQNGEYVAYEITNSFDNIVSNINQDLHESRVSRVVLVFEDEKKLKKAKKVLEQAEADLKQVTLDTIKDYFLE